MERALVVPDIRVHKAMPLGITRKGVLVGSKPISTSKLTPGQRTRYAAWLDARKAKGHVPLEERSLSESKRKAATYDVARRRANKERGAARARELSDFRDSAHGTRAAARAAQQARSEPSRAAAAQERKARAELHHQATAARRKEKARRDQLALVRSPAGTLPAPAPLQVVVRPPERVVERVEVTPKFPWKTVAATGAGAAALGAGGGYEAARRKRPAPVPQAPRPPTYLEQMMSKAKAEYPREDQLTAPRRQRRRATAQSLALPITGYGASAALHAPMASRVTWGAAQHHGGARAAAEEALREGIVPVKRWKSMAEWAAKNPRKTIAGGSAGTVLMAGTKIASRYRRDEERGISEHIGRVRSRRMQTRMEARRAPTPVEKAVGASIDKKWGEVKHNGRTYSRQEANALARQQRDLDRAQRRIVRGNARRARIQARIDPYLRHAGETMAEPIIERAGQQIKQNVEHAGQEALSTGRQLMEVAESKVAQPNPAVVHHIKDLNRSIRRTGIITGLSLGAGLGATSGALRLVHRRRDERMRAKGAKAQVKVMEAKGQIRRRPVAKRLAEPEYVVKSGKLRRNVPGRKQPQSEQQRIDSMWADLAESDSTPSEAKLPAQAKLPVEGQTPARGKPPRLRMPGKKAMIGAAVGTGAAAAGGGYLMHRRHRGGRVSKVAPKRIPFLHPKARPMGPEAIGRKMGNIVYGGGMERFKARTGIDLATETNPRSVYPHADWIQRNLGMHGPKASRDLKRRLSGGDVGETISRVGRATAGKGKTMEYTGTMNALTGQLTDLQRGGRVNTHLLPAPSSTRSRARIEEMGRSSKNPAVRARAREYLGGEAKGRRVNASEHPQSISFHTHPQLGGHHKPTPSGADMGAFTQALGDRTPKSVVISRKPSSGTRGEKRTHAITVSRRPTPEQMKGKGWNRARRQGLVGDWEDPTKTAVRHQAQDTRAFLRLKNRKGVLAGTGMTKEDIGREYGAARQVGRQLGITAKESKHAPESLVTEGRMRGKGGFTVERTVHKSKGLADLLDTTVRQASENLMSVGVRLA